MKLDLGTHVLRICEEGINRFDVFELHENKTGKSKGKIREQSFAYGVTMQRACDIVIQERMSKGQETLDIESFLVSYKETSKELVKEIKKILSTQGIDS